jgi:hypothetical protein
MNTFCTSAALDAPIRVSYHNNIHYNAIIDPQNPTFGVGLGFGDLRPGVCCKKKDQPLASLSYGVPRQDADRRQLEAAITASEQEELIRMAAQHEEARLLTFSP